MAKSKSKYIPKSLCSCSSGFTRIKTAKDRNCVKFGMYPSVSKTEA